MNDLIQRYLQALEFWLPGRKDIVAEISEDLHSQIADEEERLGRPLNNHELATVLKRRGRPVMVAHGYGPQRHLIGPVWFPIYILVLKAVIVCGVLPWTAVWFVVARVQHPEVRLFNGLFAAGGTFCSMTFGVAATVTLLFAVLQWSEAYTHFLDRWSPHQLPAVRNLNNVSLSSAITDLTVNVVFLLLWSIYARSAIVIDSPTLKLELAPNWMLFFWGFMGVALCNVALAAAHVRNRHWTRFLAAARLLLDLTNGGLFCFLMKAHLVATLYSAGLGSERSLALKNAINTWMDRCFPLAVIVAVIALTVDAMRLARVSRTTSFKPARALALSIVVLFFATAAQSDPAALRGAANASVPPMAENGRILQLAGVQCREPYRDGGSV